jgi:imidazole glycerol phosphate synthase subunit HisF
MIIRNRYVESKLAPTNIFTYSKNKMNKCILKIVDNVRIPVIAAGGIVDGKGISAALALGASGVQAI